MISEEISAIKKKLNSPTPHPSPSATGRRAGPALYWLQHLGELVLQPCLGSTVELTLVSRVTGEQAGPEGMSVKELTLNLSVIHGKGEGEYPPLLLATNSRGQSWPQRHESKKPVPSPHLLQHSSQRALHLA